MSGLTGRFLSRDPIGYWGSEWGLYEFCDEQVLISVDPLERFWDDSSGAGYPVQKFEWPPRPRGDPWGWLPTCKPPRTPRVKPGCRHNCGPVTNHFTNERVRCSKAGGDECRTTNPVPPPMGGWPTNGCGSMDPRSVEVPDFDYGPACNAHDVCYATCGKTKNQCDADFGDQMIQICKDLLRAGEYTIQEAERCISIAKGYQAAVTARANFESGQDVVCQWSPCKNKYCNCKRGTTNQMKYFIRHFEYAYFGAALSSLTLKQCLSVGAFFLSFVPIFVALALLRKTNRLKSRHQLLFHSVLGLLLMIPPYLAMLGPIYWLIMRFPRSYALRVCVGFLYWPVFRLVEVKGTVFHVVWKTYAESWMTLGY